MKQDLFRKRQKMGLLPLWTEGFPRKKKSQGKKLEVMANKYTISGESLKYQKKKLIYHEQLSSIWSRIKE